MEKVEVVYLPESGKVFHKRLAFKQGLTVLDVLKRSGLLEQYPEVARLATGVFSERVTHTDVLKASDRVEVYQPLSGCPKEKRRMRVKS